MAPRQRVLSHFAFFTFTDAYWALPSEERHETGARLVEGLRAGGAHVELYQLFPARGETDLLIWSSTVAEDPCAAATFFHHYAQATTPVRAFFRPTMTLWGFTKPSIYTRSERSPQELDPFAQERKPYLIVYPFVKTADWYLMSRDARQGMMNEHIRIGRQYPEITQLLLYSFGLQDQEFIVVYETDDLAHFSDLVMELRSSEARRFTERDTPIFTAVHRLAEAVMEVFV
ncbi:MAG: chlorite dismutase family protein [Ardenticatenia bacterium]|nr:chlorite dismutase family protein [Ardenticatenia bacterium]